MHRRGFFERLKFRYPTSDTSTQQTRLSAFRKSSMSHILAFVLGIMVATYGIAETVAQLDKAFQTVKVAMQDSGALKQSP